MSLRLRLFYCSTLKRENKTNVNTILLLQNKNVLLQTALNIPEEYKLLNTIYILQ